MGNRFYRVHIEISNICNLQCTFCPEVIRPKSVMSLELFERILQQVAPLTRTVTLHLMGDPLVHPKLQEFIELAGKHDLQVYFVTNGVLLKEKHEAMLLHPAIRQVNFSLHSFFDNFKDQDPSAYLNTIFEFTEKAFEVRPTLFINYRLWNLERGKDNRNTEMIDKIEERFNVSLKKKIADRKERNVQVKGYLSLHFETEFTWPSLSEPFIGKEGTCQGLSSHVGILVDGTVVPCCLDKEANIPLGNIREMPLSDILGGQRARAILKGFKENTLVEELCQRCDYRQRF